MNIKQILLGTTLAIASSTSFAAPVTVSGITWDPDAGSDFTADTGLFESFVGGVGDFVTGYGEVNQFNGTNQNVFAPASELTLYFKYQLLQSKHTTATFDGTNTTVSVIEDLWNSGTSSVDTTTTSSIFLGDLTGIVNTTTYNFSFGNGLVNFYADAAANFDANAPLLTQATDGILFLELVNHGLLTGNATNLFDLDTLNGQGSGFLDVIGGTAASNFNTNAETDGSDLQFTSSFHKNLQAHETGYPVGGTTHITGQTIPEPTSIALIGLGLLGFGASRIRRTA